MNRILKIILFFLLIIKTSIAQDLSSKNLDSLFNAYLHLHNFNINENQITLPNSIKHDTIHIKCATDIANSIRMNLNYFPDKQRLILKKLLERPTTDTSIISPSGFFRIHYDTTGPQAPTYSVDELAKAFDSSYNFEVNYLGYPPPPSDNGAVGDNRYDIYIYNFGGAYGETQPENEVPQGGNKYYSFIKIQNDFSDFFTKGINAAKVTAAHELHHAIQFGNYTNRYTTDGFFYELTSTSMEHFVYSTIPDYLNYLKYYFDFPDKPFSTMDGEREYALCIWNFMLQKEFGFDIIKQQWELMPSMRALDCINQSLIENGSSFYNELKNFGTWCYFTNYRFKENEFFTDAVDYPLIHLTSTIPFNSSTKTVQLNSPATSSNYISFINNNLLDTLVMIISNSDLKNGEDNSPNIFPFTFTLSDQYLSNGMKITDQYFSKINVDVPANWSVSTILNNKVINGISSNIIDYAFPSPFIYDKNQFAYFPVKPNPLGSAELKIYSVGLKLCFSSFKMIDYVNGQKVIKWNCKNEKNEKLPSGIYIYIIKSGDNLTKGKLVILNE